MALLYPELDKAPWARELALARLQGMSIAIEAAEDVDAGMATLRLIVRSNEQPAIADCSLRLE